MKTVIQRVNSASVYVDGACKGSIEHGILIFVGIRKGDTKAQAEWLADKIKRLRIFEDADGKMNMSASELGYGYLVISQFTLYGECKKGTRPSFTEAAAPSEAVPLYEYFVELMKQDNEKTATGVFGADMRIIADNDGPVTIILERDAEAN